MLDATRPVTVLCYCLTRPKLPRVKELIETETAKLGSAAPAPSLSDLAAWLVPLQVKNPSRCCQVLNIPCC